MAMAAGSDSSQGRYLARDGDHVEDEKSAEIAEEESSALIRRQGSRSPATPATPQVAPSSSTERGRRRRPPSAGLNRSEEGRRNGGSIRLFQSSSSRKRGESDDEELVRALHVAAEDLVDRLFAFLSGLPLEDEQEEEGTDGAAIRRLTKGATLPASAVGWLATRLNRQMEIDDECDAAMEASNTSSVSRERLPDSMRPSSREASSPLASSNVRASPIAGSGALAPSLASRVALLRYLVPRLRCLRITGDAWPAAKPAKASSRFFGRSSKATTRTATTPRPQRDAASVSMSDAADNSDIHMSPIQLRVRNLMYRPRVDLRMFRNVQVLVLNQVPAECVVNLACLVELQVLRIENACIYSLPQLFLEGSSQDKPVEASATPSADPLKPVSPVPIRASLMPSLRRIRISNCNLTCDALFRRPAPTDGGGGDYTARQARLRRCPLERMTRLESICLSHNQLHNSKVLLRALRNKPWLSELDVSHNTFRDLRHAPQCLGNLQSLNVSHNRLMTVDGIDKLLSLETLWLNDNLLPTLASIAALARLPVLHTLHLRNNPLTSTSDSSSSFENPTLTNSSSRTRRRSPAISEAAYRMYVFDLLLQLRMPVLNGNTTLRQVQDALNLTLDGRGPTVKELLSLRTRAYASVDLPTGRGSASDLAEANGAGEDGFVLVERNVEGPSSGFGPRSRRCRRRKASLAQVEEFAGGNKPHKERHLVVDASSSSTKSTAKFSVLDVLVHLSPAPEVCEGSVLLEDSIADMDDAAPENRLETKEGAGEVGPQVEISIPADHTTIEEPEPADGQSGGSLGDDQMDLLSASSMNDSRIATDLDLSYISPIQHRKTEGGMKASGTTTAATSTGETRTNDEVQVDAVETGDLVSDERTGFVPTAAPLEDRPSSESSNTTPIQQLSYRVPTSTSLWQDDNLSVASCSVAGAASNFEESVAQHKYIAAEENSVFDAAPYKGLNVMQNLGLYFRLYVFNYEMPPPNVSSAAHSIASVSGINDQNDWLSVLETYPKIQLWPIDRRMREAYADKARLGGKDETKEEFRMAWREKVVACGKPALRRLTPNRGARFGFHGELLWSDASASHIKPETIAEAREVLLCMSSTTLYFIVTNDSVASRTNGKDPFRKFPTCIPDDATFEKGRWPHALAWHPFHTLTGITIGFCFQRLTLRFANSTFPSPDDFTYVLLTSNKLETVRLLKEVQAMAVEAQRETTHRGSSHAEITIDNDDRHVLDALGVAVAPDVIGVVLHYQILSQHWRHGDRGSVRRVCLVTDTTVYLMDEDYIGDGSESLEAGYHRTLGETTYRVVDSAPLTQISIVKAADADPCTLTLSIRPTARLSRTHNWRLTCRDRHGAEQLVEDVRKALPM